MGKSSNDFSGKWECSHWYPSNNHDGDDVTKHIMNANQTGNRITMTSMQPKHGSYLTVRLNIEDGLATGAWQETTTQESEFHGITYSGAMQLIISDDGQHMDGKWVGIGREKLDDGSYEPRIYTGKWELVRASD